MSTVTRGNKGENAVATHGREQGWLVSSLRHEGGAGDQIWMKVGQPSRLVEVKNAKNLWQNFRREDRSDLLDRAAAYHLDPLLVNVRFRTVKGFETVEFDWYSPDSWPK